jgi:hypothetical protein
MSFQGVKRYAEDRDRQWLRRDLLICFLPVSGSMMWARTPPYARRTASRSGHCFQICRLELACRKATRVGEATAPMVRSIGDSEFSEACRCGVQHPSEEQLSFQQQVPIILFGVPRGKRWRCWSVSKPSSILGTYYDHQRGCALGTAGLDSFNHFCFKIREVGRATRQYSSISVLAGP